MNPPEPATSPPAARSSAAATPRPGSDHGDPVEVAILGAGVAAAAAARTLAAAGRSFALVAPAAAPGPRIGESLPHSARRELRALGAWDGFLAQRHRRSHATFSCWGSDRLIERNAAFEAGGAGWIVDRESFERGLWAGVEAAAARRVEARYTAAERQARGWRLAASGGLAVEARFVLDCTGRAAAFGRRRAAQRRAGRLLAAYDFLEHADPDVAPTPGVLIEATRAGWWYSSLSPGGELIVVFFTDAELMPSSLAGDRERWRRLLGSSRWTARRIDSAGFALGAGPRLTDAGMVRLERFAGAGWAAAGDAAAAIDPLAAHGITTALWSGRRAALAAAAALDGDPEPSARYAADLEEAYAAVARRLPAIYGRERRFSDAPFWRPRLAAADAARGRG